MALYDHEGTRGLAPLSILGQHAMCHLYSSQILTFHPSTLHPTPPILPSSHPPIPEFSDSDADGEYLLPETTPPAILASGRVYIRQGDNIHWIDDKDVMGCSTI